jgi:cysteine sulfinate desulfinase/cysteine desulfurase-like protein
MTLGHTTTEADVERGIEVVVAAVTRLRQRSAQAAS